MCDRGQEEAGGKWKKGEGKGWDIARVAGTLRWECAIVLRLTKCLSQS